MRISLLASTPAITAALVLAASTVLGQTPGTGLKAGAGAASAPAASRSALDKPTLEAYLRHMELWVPQVMVKIDDPTPSPYFAGFSDVAVHLSFNGQGKDEHYLVSKDGSSVFKGQSFNINRNPFQSNIDRLNTDQQPSYGTPGAPVVLVVFGDFECPLCKAEADVMRGNVVKTFGEKVRVYFKDFPIESLHPWARPASIAGRCVFRQNPQTFWDFHDWIYKQQQSITVQNLNDQVFKWAGTSGLDSIQLGRCIESKATDAEIAKNMQEGTALGVDGTPTTFLNGRPLPGILDWTQLEPLIKLEIEHQEKFHDAGDPVAVK
jgi:protein-disulfide isomerase